MIGQQVGQLVERIGSNEWLDRLAKPVSGTVARVVAPKTTLKDGLSGTWLGHPLHPLLTDVVIGSWTSAWFLDVFGGKRSQGAADALVGIGLVSAIPTVASGLSDWSDLYGAEQRIGLAHAGGNAVATVAYGLSLAARRRGSRGLGVALGMVGAAAVTVGGYLGGHLAYRLGVNVDRNAWRETPTGWTRVAKITDVPDDGLAGGSIPGHAGDEPVVLAKASGRACAIGGVCGHAGAPLAEGTVDADGRVTCPWHSSVFRIQDGSVVHGPATGPQPAYDVKVEGGEVSVRARTS